MPLPDFDTLEPVETKSKLPDFDSLKPYSAPTAPPTTPRFDTSKIKLTPYQEIYAETGMTDPSRDPSMTMADIVGGHGGSAQSAANVYRMAGAAPGAILSGVGNVARGYGADFVSAMFNDPEYGGNLRALVSDDTMPVDKFLSEVSRTNPKLATLGKIGQGVAGTAPMLAIGDLPAAAQKAALVGFTAKMISDAPQIATQLGDELGKPKDQQDPDKISSLVSDAVQVVGFSAVGAVGAKRAFTKPVTPPMQGPLATGAIMQPPRGAIPTPTTGATELGQIPGVPTQGIPARPIVDLGPKPTGYRPVVPGTPAEPRETSIATIRRAQAKTIAQIQQLFPKAQLSREQARALRNTAWGIPEPPTPSTHAIHEKAEEVLRPVQQPSIPQEGAGQVPANEPGPPTGARGGPIPGAQAGQVLLNARDRINEVLGQSGPDFVKSLEGKKLTQSAYDLGLSVTSPEDLQALKSAQKKNTADFQAALKADDKQLAAYLGFKGQFFGEAYGAATGTGSAAEYLRKGNPNYKPPFPEVEATTGIADTKAHPTVEVPVTEITTSPDVPNFKADADPETGIVPGERLTGTFQRIGTAPIVLWERLNGRKEIVTGRHRLDLARRTGEKTIPAQIMRETDGFTKGEALIFDAESNIRDGQGSVEDYAHYFKNTPALTEAEARTRGLLSRAKGTDGWQLGKNAADDLYSLWRDKKIATEKAVAIASAAPGNADLQSLGIKQAGKGKSPAEIENFIKAVQAQIGGAPEQVDLFGRDETAIRQAEEMAAKATERQNQLAEQIRAVQGAAKRPELARKLGVDIKDPAGVLKRIDELKAERARWENWFTQPDLVVEVGGKPTPPPAPVAAAEVPKFEVGEMVTLTGPGGIEQVNYRGPLPDNMAVVATKRGSQISVKTSQLSKIEAKPTAAPGELFGPGETPFNLTGETTKVVPPKTEQTAFGGETLTQNELFGIRDVVREIDPEKSANVAQKMAGGDAAKAAIKLRRQVAVMDAYPKEYKSFGKEQRARLKEVIALLDQRAGGERTLGFGGTEIRQPVPVPTANTPEELSTLVKTHTPGLDAARQGIASLLLPTAKSPEHLHAAEILGAKLGAMNHRAEATAHALRPAEKFFDRLGVHNEKLTPDKNPGIRFMSNMSQGREFAGQHKAIASLIQKLFAERLTKLAEAGAPLQTVRENYFPGMWTRESRMAFNAALEQAVKEGIIPKGADVNDATPAQKAWVKARVDQFLENGTGSDRDMLSYFTRRPLKGRESFRKQKVFDDIMTAAEFGLRPVSNNPIDLVKGKLAEMDKSIMANEFFRQLREEDSLKIINPYQKTPDGWVRLNDKYGTIYGPPAVGLKEYVDKNVFDGLMRVAKGLGITPERVFSAGRGRLGYASTGGQTVTQFATELSVLAHELGHQLDFRYDLWDKMVKGITATGKKGQVTKAASAALRGKIQKQLRALADLTWEGSEASPYYKKKVRKQEEKMAHMLEAYIHAPERFQEVAPTVFDNFDKFILSKPELRELADIKQGLALEQLTTEKYVGLPIMGYRIVPKAVGDIVNNYLSSSIYNNRYFGGLYRLWMHTANSLNQTQLGMGSAFHAGFTTADVQVSAGANLIKDIYGVLRGNRSAADLGDTVKKWTTASVQTAMTGDRVLNAWRNPDGVIDPRIAQVVKATELAGAGYRMEYGLRTYQTGQMSRDWFSGHRLRAAVRSPIALTELMMRPIMDYLVPRQKAGVFAELAWRIIEQNPGKPLEELTPQFRQAWNRVDARLGQVRYNRLFIHNTAKNAAQGLIRAPGWSGGTIAELGGSLPDAAKFLQEWKTTGRLPADIPDRVAYTLSLLATVGAVNGALTYAFTGQMPGGMDYFAFRTGHKDKDGNAERFLLPTYVKDLLAYAKQPLITLGHKSHPLLSVLNDVIQNRDYYGYEVRDPSAPVTSQLGQVGKYVVKSYEPFWTRGARKTWQTSSGVTRLAAPYFGTMPAPAYITRTSIQNEISRLYHLRTGERTKPYAAREADAAKRAARDTSAMDVYMFKRLPKTDQAALGRKMSPQEKARYGVAGEAGLTAADVRRAAPWAVTAQ